MKSYTNKTLPNLKEPQCYIFYCEVSTGIILTLDGKYSLNADEFPVILFDSYEEAKDFAEKKIIENPEIECTIMNHNEEHVERIVNYKTATKTQENAKLSRKWWKFW